MLAYFYMCRGHLELFNDFGNSRYIDGTLKIEDKSNSAGNFTYFKYYDMFGSFDL